MADSKNQAVPIKPEQIIDIIIRRRWIIIIPLCISLTLGLILVLMAPRIYESSTTILIQPQKVPTDYVQSIVTTDTEQRINTISQEILSRTNLEKIIKEFDLYKDEEILYREDMLDNMRKRVVVTQESTGRQQGTAAFSVSFKGDKPETVMNVANRLATFFMDENLKAREVQAVGTSEFLESELEKIKKKLEDREGELAAYRAAHMGGLPDELETNLRTLDRLQVQHSDALSALRETQNSIALLKNQISRLKEMGQGGSVAVQADGTVVGGSNLTTVQQQYESEKRQLDELLLKYTEKHPEVVKLSKSVAKLKEKIEKEAEEKKTQPQGNKSEKIASNSNNVLFQYEFNLKQLENDAVNIKNNISQINETMKVYQKRVEDTPKREQELQSIQRDYNNIRDSYNSLLARRLEAELSVNMEKKQKGEQFRIIDYARLPEKPISPDIRKFFLFSAAVGLGISGAIIFLLEFLNPVIRREEQIEIEIGLPILASISPLGKPGDKKQKQMELILFSTVSLYTTAILLCFMLLNLKGIEKTVEFIKPYINI